MRILHFKDELISIEINRNCAQQAISQNQLNHNLEEKKQHICIKIKRAAAKEKRKKIRKESEKRKSAPRKRKKKEEKNCNKNENFMFSSVFTWCLYAFDVCRFEF